LLDEPEPLLGIGKRGQTSPILGRLDLPLSQPAWFTPQTFGQQGLFLWR
jgi:hypothetical protein